MRLSALETVNSGAAAAGIGTANPITQVAVKIIARKLRITASFHIWLNKNRWRMLALRMIHSQQHAQNQVTQACDAYQNGMLLRLAGMVAYQYGLPP